MEFLCIALAVLSLTWFYKAKCGRRMGPFHIGSAISLELEMFFETKNIL